MTSLHTSTAIEFCHMTSAKSGGGKASMVAMQSASMQYSPLKITSPIHHTCKLTATRYHKQHKMPAHHSMTELNNLTVGLVPCLDLDVIHLYAFMV